jgi:hypothetical protein
MNHVLGLHYNIIPLCSLFLTKISNLLNGLTMHIFTLLSTSLKFMGVLQKAFYPLHLSIASHFTNIFTNSLNLFFPTYERYELLLQLLAVFLHFLYLLFQLPTGSGLFCNFTSHKSCSWHSLKMDDPHSGTRGICYRLDIKSR